MLFVVCCLIPVLSACAYFTSSHDDKPEYVLWYAENQASDFPTSLGAKRFAELVRERTNGRIEILVQTEGQLGEEVDVVSQMQFGGVDFARISLSQISDKYPELNVLQMPYLYRDSDHMWRVLDGETGESFKNGMSAYGLVGLSWYDAGARSFYFRKRPDDWRNAISGMRIRVQGSRLMVDMVESLGATGVPMSYSEVYSGLERGIIDAAENNIPSYESSEHNRVAGCFVMDEHTRVPEIQLCSAVTWNKLQPEDQEIIRRCAEESARYEREVWKTREAESKRKLISGGTEIITVSAEEKAELKASMQSVYEKYCQDYMEILRDIEEQ